MLAPIAIHWWIRNSGPSWPVTDAPQAVEQAPLRDQHEMDRGEDDHRRQRPGHQVDGQQRPDPPASDHEEAGQQEGQEHLHVHADGDEQQRVDQR